MKRLVPWIPFLLTAALAGKAAAAGSVISWGGSGARVAAWGMTRDAASNVYVVGGYYNSVDFDPSPAADWHDSNGDRDAFLSKFGADGAWQWTKTWGSSNDDRANSVAVYETNVYVAGCFQDTVDFNPAGGCPLTAPRGTNGYPNNNAYLSKFGADGAFLWARDWGGNGGDEAYHAALDAAGHVYVNGDFSSTNLSLVTVGLPGSVTNNGFFDAFIFKFNEGGTCLWARCWGGICYDDCTCSAVDPSGTVYGGGMFASPTADFDPGPAVSNLYAHNTFTNPFTFLGLVDVFLTKFDADGNFLWARSWGATNLNDAASGLAVDAADNVFVGGYFEDTVDFNPTGTPSNLTTHGAADAFLCKLDAAGSLLWARSWGGTNTDGAGAIALDGLGYVYAAGTFASTNVDFDPGGGNDPHSTHGGQDISLSKFDTDGNLILARTCGGSGNDTGYGGLALDAAGQAYVSGQFVGSVDFGPLLGGGATNPPAYGTIDAYLAQIPTCWKLTVVKSGNGGSSLGDATPAERMISLNISTQVVYTAGDWYRIASLASNGVAIAPAAGLKAYTQALDHVAADLSNAVAFDMATPAQTGYTNVPTAWLTNWAENAVITDPAFDVQAKYLLGLDPTTLNSLELQIESAGVSGSNAVTVVKRSCTGGLSPDGLHGQLELQAADTPDSAYSNLAGTAVSGAAVFDNADRKTYTNLVPETTRFIRAVIH